MLHKCFQHRVLTVFAFGSLRRYDNHRHLLTDNTVSVPIVHEPIRRMTPRHRCYAVTPRLRARYLSITVVVPKRKRIAPVLARPQPLSGIPGYLWKTAFQHDHFRGRTAGERPFDRNRFATVDAQAVLSAHLKRSIRKPARVALRLPLGGILRAFLVPVHTRTCQRQVQHIACKPGLRRRTRRSTGRCRGLRTGARYARCPSLAPWRNTGPVYGP